MAGPETEAGKPKPEAPKTTAPGGGDATRYVGTPAVGTSKAAASAGLATVGPEPSQVNERRRRLVWVAVTGFLGAWFIAETGLWLAVVAWLADRGVRWLRRTAVQRWLERITGIVLIGFGLRLATESRRFA